jgi:predicted RNase H-like nuclease (RuvC/YqgF family)
MKDKKKEGEFDGRFRKAAQGLKNLNTRVDELYKKRKELTAEIMECRTQVTMLQGDLDQLQEAYEEKTSKRTSTVRLQSSRDSSDNRDKDRNRDRDRHRSRDRSRDRKRSRSRDRTRRRRD